MRRKPEPGWARLSREGVAETKDLADLIEQARRFWLREFTKVDAEDTGVEE